MIIWLASYPRSGNTMFRHMVHRVFARRTYTKYNPPDRPWRDNAGNEPLALPYNWSERYGVISQDRQARYLVKTHDYPEDDGKAIYIVRHGLAAIRSYQCYLRDIDHEERSLEQVIRGETFFGSWGSHLDAWDPLNRPDTLVLKYEELVDRPDEQLDRVAEFLGLTRVGEWVNEFEKRQAAEPKVYRQGPSVPPEVGSTKAQQEMFYNLHGDWMARLGYAKGDFNARPALRAALPGPHQRSPAAVQP